MFNETDEKINYELDNIGKAMLAVLNKQFKEQLGEEHAPDLLALSQ
jgi:hypothetical protein